jgi:hypothetical protein
MIWPMFLTACPSLKTPGDDRCKPRVVSPFLSSGGAFIGPAQASPDMAGGKAVAVPAPA